MPNNRQKRDIHKLLADRIARDEEIIAKRDQEINQKARITMLLNGLNPASRLPFTDEELNEMRKKASTPQHLHFYKRIQAGRAGLGRAFDETTVDPFCGMTPGDFREKMDDFYTGLGWNL